jgi:hypothetical protein
VAKEECLRQELGRKELQPLASLKALPQIRANMGNLAPREYIEAIKDSQNNEFLVWLIALKGIINMTESLLGI